jgi:hypothetical protein
MLGTTRPAYAVSYSVVGCRESGRTLVERLLGRLRGNGPGRVVHVIRDGRDAAVDAWEGKGDRPLFRQLKKGSVPFSFDDYVESFATHWVSFIEHVREAAEGHDDRYHELRYETLMSDPAAAIERLLEFLRIDASPDTVTGCMQRVNFAACTAGDWRHRFDGEAAFRFDAVAGYLLQQLGYSEPTSTGLRRAA